VTSPRTLSFRLLLSSLTGLVLFAIAAACPDLRLHDQRAAGAVEASSQAPRIGDAGSRERRTVLAATADLDIDDEEQPRVASLETLDAAGERLAFAATLLISRRAARPTHRPCAFPPTGPPHA
jgi:hypothetical protein